MGGVLLITLSVSVAFGAGPAATLDSPPGESIAEFVHGLIFSPDDPESDPESTDPEVLGDPGEDEDGPHGECVSEVARSDAVGGPNDNHGGAVSEAAHETCPDADDEDPIDEDPIDEDPIDEDQPVVEENGDEEDSHGACVSEAAQDKDASADSDDDRNHGAWVSKHARFICRGLEPPDGEDGDTAELIDKEERKAQRAAARAERKAAQAAAKAERRGGNGRGGGRP